jgi:hypothetical protein
MPHGHLTRHMLSPFNLEHPPSLFSAWGVEAVGDKELAAT